MRLIARRLLLCALLAAAPAGAASEEGPVDPAGLEKLNDSLRAFSEGLFLQKSTQAARASVRARNPSDFSLELRPQASDDDAGIALRIYLPNRWSGEALREQLDLAAASETLRVAELEERDLLAVYRDFCTYRMLRKQTALYRDKMELIAPVLERADRSVQRRELAVGDRARLYTLYLDLANDLGGFEGKKIEIEHALHRALGSGADLDALADAARVDMPSEAELDELFRQALAQRADYRRLSLEARALTAARDRARAEDGFRFKYIQPGYAADYEGGEDTWSVSAAFVLPWGERNPDIDELQAKRELADFELALQRRILKDRLRTLIRTAEELRMQQNRQDRLLQPLRRRLTADLRLMGSGPPAQIRDRLQIVVRLMDSAREAAAAECRREMLAVDFAEELGSLRP